MQYYFARTGLLDGKGAQLAKDRWKKPDMGTQRSFTIVDPEAGFSAEPSSLDSSLDDISFDASGPMGLAITGDGFDPDADPQDLSMLPPTVSTYRYKEDLLQPLPDMPVLRRELCEALDNARKVLQDPGVEATPVVSVTDESSPPDSPPQDTNQGWYELQGLHILDIVTLAIRAAKNYYTCHNSPQKLYALKSERAIRSELYQVLEVLKRMASRNFRGGTRSDEQRDILDWIKSIVDLLAREEEQEKEEQAMRQQWSWLQGDWEGRERERELMFLKSFDQANLTPLPAWTEVAEDGGPTPFLESLRTGLRLIHLHNQLVARSRRKYGEIKTFHTDFGKPYRCAENIRFWMKAAELRWEVRLDLNALDVANGRDQETWRRFDWAILTWCKAVRSELTAELLVGSEATTVASQAPALGGSDLRTGLLADSEAITMASQIPLPGGDELDAGLLVGGETRREEVNV